MRFLEAGEGVQEVLLRALLLADVAASCRRVPGCGRPRPGRAPWWWKPSAAFRRRRRSLLAVEQRHARAQDRVVVRVEAFGQFLREKIEDGLADDFARRSAADRGACARDYRGCSAPRCLSHRCCRAACRSTCGAGRHHASRCLLLPGGPRIRAHSFDPDSWHRGRRPCKSGNAGKLARVRNLRIFGRNVFPWGIILRGEARGRSKRLA